MGINISKLYPYESIHILMILTTFKLMDFQTKRFPCPCFTPARQVFRNYHCPVSRLLSRQTFSSLNYYFISLSFPGGYLHSYARYFWEPQIILTLIIQVDKNYFQSFFQSKTIFIFSYFFNLHLRSKWQILSSHHFLPFPKVNLLW